MKTPDKIEKGLRWCGGLGQALDGCEGGCPYWDKKYGCGIDQMHKEARAYILELESQVPKWISVKERLPDEDTEVLYYNGFHCNMGWLPRAATHWMPLPEPPKED